MIPEFTSKYPIPPKNQWRHRLAQAQPSFWTKTWRGKKQGRSESELQSGGDELVFVSSSKQHFRHIMECHNPPIKDTSWKQAWREAWRLGVPRGGQAHLNGRSSLHLMQVLFSFSFVFFFLMWCNSFNLFAILHGWTFEVSLCITPGSDSDLIGAKQTACAGFYSHHLGRCVAGGTKKAQLCCQIITSPLIRQGGDPPQQVVRP